MRQDSDALNLEQVLGILRRRVSLIALCVVVVAGAALGYSKHQPKKYMATASLAFSSNQLSQQIAGLPATSSDVAAQQALNLELVKLGDMAAKTAGLLGHGLTEGDVDASLSIAAQGESSVVEVSATANSPSLAAAIANTYTRQFVNEQQVATSRYFKSALALVSRQLAKLSRAQRLGQDGVELQNRAQTLGLLSELHYGNVQIAQEALAPTSPSSPKTSRNTGLGALLGLLIGLGLAFVLERFDHRIRRTEDLETIYRLPILGIVPKSAALSRSTRHNADVPAALPPAEAETFNLIRARLRFFNGDRNLRTILIASAAPGEGKTTVARHLAEAAARLGSRVLLLEMDLRHPTLARKMGVQVRAGVADVLIGAASIDAAIQSVDVAVPCASGTTGHTLDMLTAGTMLPPNPAELLESHAVDVMLARAKSTYDLVVIDTPSLTAVSDAFPLLTKVDGVVIVGWVGRSQRDASEQLQQILISSGAPLLGVVSNGSQSGGRPSSYISPGEDRSPPAITSTNGTVSPDALISTASSALLVL